MAAPCRHLEGLELVDMPDGGCEECIAAGDTWMHLRVCTTCGHIGCCDSSKNKHARAHAASADHQVVRSKEPGEHWAYCFADDVAMLTRDR